MPILTSTLAIAGIGTTFTNVKRIIPKSIFFISLPPYSHHIDFYLYYSIPEQFLKIILSGSNFAFEHLIRNCAPFALKETPHFYQ
jgi:hypothetical protein